MSSEKVSNKKVALGENKQRKKIKQFHFLQKATKISWHFQFLQITTKSQLLFPFPTLISVFVKKIKISWHCQILQIIPKNQIVFPFSLLQNDNKNQLLFPVSPLRRPFRPFFWGYQLPQYHLESKKLVNRDWKPNPTIASFVFLLDLSAFFPAALKPPEKLGQTRKINQGWHFDKKKPFIILILQLEFLKRRLDSHETSLFTNDCLEEKWHPWNTRKAKAISPENIFLPSSLLPGGVFCPPQRRN